MFSFICFVLWIVSLVMMFVDYHWGWLVVLVLTTLYFILRFGAGGSGPDFGFDFDIGD